MASFRTFREGAWTVIDTVSQTAAAFRWVLVPLGLVALMACGVHAAADTVDDRILRVVDALDAALDNVWSRFTWTHSWVDVVGLEQRVWVSRALALLWELAADIVLCAPAFGYDHLGPGSQLSSRPDELKTWTQLLARAVKKPTLSRVVRPLATGLLALAGACTVARGVGASMYGALRQGMPEGVAGSVAKLVAAVALLSVTASLGSRAFLRSFEHAHELSERAAAKRWDVAFLRGWWGAVLVAPLALAALLDATPLLSFFR